MSVRQCDPDGDAEEEVAIHNAHAHPQTTTIGPSYDAESQTKPLERAQGHARDLYPEFMSQDVLTAPSPPADYKDGDYLAPVLSRNEYLRLTKFWYYARNLCEDKDLLSNLQVKVGLLKDFVGWDMAICGILDNRVYTRIAASGLELASLPRRESTCSHTIHGTGPKDIFMIPDMSEDWRFKDSPQVIHGGLRSYAGTALRFDIDGEGAVALGAVCVASNTPHASLTKFQKDALLRLSDMITTEIVDRQRLSRRDTQRLMNERVTRATSLNDPDKVEKAIMSILKETYPDSHVDVCHARTNYIALDHDREIPLSDIDHGLWEDSALIDQLIVTSNHLELKSEHMVRAVVGRFWSSPVTNVLVVCTNEVTHVYDDIDAWFVDRCSTILSQIAQQRSLQKARNAKEQFLRGITHQLRTPIHGVLGSVDILTEELAAGYFFPQDNTSSSVTTSRVSENSQDLVENPSPSAFNASDVLRTIQNSGRELMSTVNNMIKLNHWAEMTDTPTDPALNDISNLEEMLLEETTRMLPDAEVERLCIFFDNELPKHTNTALIDVNLIKEVLHSVLLNAFQYTPVGCVIVNTSLSDNGNQLVFEVKDTGRGIHSENKERIFVAYEKEDVHGRGLGLGLTLASKIASAMDGSVELVKSAPDAGSTFRITFRGPALGCRIGMPSPDKGIPKPRIVKFATIPENPQTYTLQHLVKYLQRRGLQLTDPSDDCLLLVSYYPSPELFQEYLQAARDFRGTAVCLIPSSENREQLQQDYPHISFLTGPFTSKRMEEIMEYLEDMYTKQQAGTDGASSSHCAADSSSVDVVAPTGFPTTLPTRVAKRGHSIVTPNVLLVDDNLINLRIVRMYCEKRHLPYKTATDGFEAIEAYKAGFEGSRAYQLILLDLQMPNCDGIEACEQIRKLERENGLEAAVIFIVTGQDSPKDRELATKAGANEYYVKPLGLKSLDRAIGRYFDAPS
ncbi:Hybrid signal transduction protein dokA [Elsinoe australis]|uniref:histidine kinase n=1 Tax=Elsinoe australis TaxID=40998 RepID=A0A2P8A0U7_9PEZI|nr:Hybrid signal transduction protein dokA [Elsinoe australis]